MRKTKNKMARHSENQKRNYHIIKVMSWCAREREQHGEMLVRMSPGDGHDSMAQCEKKQLCEKVWKI